MDFVPEENIKSLLGLKGWLGTLCTDAVMAFVGINRLNRTFRPIEGLKGYDFAEAALECLQVKTQTEEDFLSSIPETGPFIVCSNHPFGCLDGLILLREIGKKRSDVLFMTNYILSRIPCLQKTFIPVDPFVKGASRSVSGVKAALEQLGSGSPLVMFPAGEVSSDRNSSHIVKDIEWETGAARLIMKAGVPVIPAYFDGTNSKFFHFLGHIHPFLRTLRLPLELLNKKGCEIPLRFGRAITPNEIAGFSNPKELASYLRNRSYALEASVTKHEVCAQERSLSPIEPHVDTSLLRAELESLGSSLLFKEGGYSCFVNRCEEIPNIMREIGICREETFRLNGEGTGKSIDLDEFDEYYLHLHLWDEEECRLVGAYRIGRGEEILRDKGIPGFYTDLFFHYNDEAAPMLANGLELGRSFVVPDFQVVPNALKMLLHKGIGEFCRHHGESRYLFGAASISSDIPKMFSSIMVEYFKRTMSDPSLNSLVRPVNPFVPDFGRIDVESLKLEELSIDRCDRLLSRLTGGKYRIPTLIRAYAKSGCRFLGFNVDHGFNDCIDSLLVVDLNKLQYQ